jgi:CheY-like chemotaxis protein
VDHRVTKRVIYYRKLHFCSDANYGILIFGVLRRNAISTPGREQSGKAESEAEKLSAKRKEGPEMARIITVGLERSTAQQLSRALGIERHEISHKPKSTPLDEVIDADIVFADGEGKRYLPLLKQVREAHPALPFVVVTRVPETADWLDALEAGATDYCSAPFESRQLSWLMETAGLVAAQTVAA